MISADTLAITNRTLDEILTQICHQLQITAEQQKQAESRYVAIGRALEAAGSPLAPHGPTLYPQGSLKIGTTVKPIGREEFDLDIVCELNTDARRFPHPPRLITGISSYLDRLPAYVGKIRVKNRCVRVAYADQFHIDILPACQDPSNGGTHLVVPDRSSQGWKPSNPKGYAAWFESRCAFTSRFIEGKAEPIPPKEPVAIKPTLKLATQLLKRWRDLAYAHSKDHAPISIILTTLTGLHYGGQDSVSTALTEIVEKIVAELPPIDSRLIVLNPVNPQEDLSEKWDTNPKAYRAFAIGMNDLLRQLRGLFVAQPLDSLCERLSKLFGEDTSKAAIREFAQSVESNRTDGSLYARRHSGALSKIGASAAVIPVRPHTFYGS
jgi:hypothetical protein